MSGPKDPSAAFPFSTGTQAGGAGRFCTTQWTMVLAAGGSDGPERDAAMELFCRIYWYPVYAFLRRRGSEPEDARDLAQGFFARIIEQRWLAQVRQRETRFSTLLVAILKNFAVEQHRRDVAQKRGGGVVPLSIDLAQAEQWFGAEPSTTETPERIFERRWALAVLDAALGRLRAECQTVGRGRHFDALSAFLSREPAAGEYDRAAAALRLSPKSVAVAVHRLRAQYRAMVREEVAAGLDDPARIDEELRHLAEAL